MMVICTENCQPPSWFRGLSRQDKAELLAWYGYRNKQAKLAALEASDRG